jgi:hypothetical protein
VSSARLHLWYEASFMVCVNGDKNDDVKKIGCRSCRRDKRRV